MSITIRQAYGADHWYAIVEYKGREYRASYAEKPEESKVAADFHGDRKAKRLADWK